MRRRYGGRDRSVHSRPRGSDFGPRSLFTRVVYIILTCECGATVDRGNRHSTNLQQFLRLDPVATTDARVRAWLAEIHVDLWEGFAGRVACTIAADLGQAEARGDDDEARRLAMLRVVVAEEAARRRRLRDLGVVDPTVESAERRADRS